VRVAPLSGAISIAAIVIVAALMLLLLFEPGLPYRVAPSRASLGSREFVNYLSAIVNARLLATGELTVLNSGAAIYAAELDAMRRARRSIHLEVYLSLLFFRHPYIGQPSYSKEFQPLAQRWYAFYLGTQSIAFRSRNWFIHFFQCF